MSVIYSLIGLGEVIFVEYTDFSGNFALTANKILKACKDTKYTKYPANNYIFYILNCECIFLVMCDRSYSERIAFSYLETIRKMFTSSFSEEKIMKGKMYEMMEFAPVLKTQMRLYNEPEQVDKVARLMK